MNSKNPTGYLAKPSTLPLARASRHAGTRDLGKTLHSRDGVNLHHPLYLLPNGPVVKEESRKVSYVAWLDGDVNTCEERYVEPKPRVVKHATVTNNTDSEEGHECQNSCASSNAPEERSISLHFGL